MLRRGLCASSIAAAGGPFASFTSIDINASGNHSIGGSSVSGSGTNWVYALPEPSAPEPELHSSKLPLGRRAPAATAPPASPMVGGSGLAAAAAGGAVVDPVLRAAFEADLDRLKELLTGDPAGALNRDGEGLLHLAATSPSPSAPDAIDLLVIRGKIPIDGADALGRTPLHALAARACVGRRGAQGPAAAVLEAMLRHGADVNAPEPRHGRTPLHLAVAAGSNLTLLRALLQHGADPSLRDRHKETPLMLARRLWRRHFPLAHAPSAAVVGLLLAHAAGDDLVVIPIPVEEEEEEGEEHESPLRFVRGRGPMRRS